MIVDTNIYSNAAKNIEAAVEIFNANENIYLPIFVIAELEYGFIGSARAEANKSKFNYFLSEEGVNVLYPTLKTTVAYAELAVFAKKSGRVLANNDIWVSALALENKMPLATFDKDFSVFESFLGKDLIILE